MSDPTQIINQLNSLVSHDDFYIAVGVLGGTCGILLCGFIGLAIWVASLQKKIKKLNYLANFKIQRPQLKPRENEYNFTPPPSSSLPKADYDYDNQGYRPSDRASSVFKPPGGGTSMNPIASRAQQPQQQQPPPPFASNSNFTYGPVPPQFNNIKMPNENSRFGGGY